MEFHNFHYSVGVCLEVFKNLHFIQFHDGEFVKGSGVYMGIENLVKVENKVKKLELKSWRLHKGNLKELVKIFPYVEDFRMINCFDFSLGCTEDFSNLVTYLETISKWTHLQNLLLIDTFYLDTICQNYMSPAYFDRDINEVLDFINNTFSQNAEIEITFGHYMDILQNEQTLIATIFKKNGTEASLLPPRLRQST